MKKLIFTLLLTIPFSVSSEDISENDGAPIEREFHSCSGDLCGIKIVDKFHLTSPSLSKNVVYGESFFADGDNEVDHVYKTAFTPNLITKVYNPRTNEVYRSGKDYKIVSDGITITKKSTIVKSPVGFKDDMTDSDREKYKVKLSTAYADYQYAIDYTKDEKYKNNIYGRINYNCNPCRITFFGDSISAGANASSEYAPPHQPDYVRLVMSYLQLTSPKMKWLYRNNSVGGWNTNNAASAYKWRVNDQFSDIVILAFGMNDGGGIEPSLYINNIDSIIQGIRNKQPNSSIILVGSTRANPYSSIQIPDYITSYIKGLEQLTTKYNNVVYVNATSMWDKVMEKKSYYDLTGNGLNHPNDYGHKLIAEEVISAIKSK